MIESLDKIWTVRALAEAEHCAPNSLYTLIYNGELPAYTILLRRRRVWRIKDSDWQAYVAKHRMGGGASRNRNRNRNR